MLLARDLDRMSFHSHIIQNYFDKGPAGQNKSTSPTKYSSGTDAINKKRHLQIDMTHKDSTIRTVSTCVFFKFIYWTNICPIRISFNTRLISGLHCDTIMFRFRLAKEKSISDKNAKINKKINSFECFRHQTFKLMQIQINGIRRSFTVTTAHNTHHLNSTHPIFVSERSFVGIICSTNAWQTASVNKYEFLVLLRHRLHLPQNVDGPCDSLNQLLYIYDLQSEESKIKSKTLHSNVFYIFRKVSFD